MSKRVVTQIPIDYSIDDAIRQSRRPVTKKDTWCNFSKKRDDPDVPYGLVYSLPYGISTSFPWLSGDIIRSKRKGNQFLIQVVFVSQKKRSYSINYKKMVISEKTTGKARTYTYHFMNINSKK